MSVFKCPFCDLPFGDAGSLSMHLALRSICSPKTAKCNDEGMVLRRLITRIRGACDDALDSLETHYPFVYGTSRDATAKCRCGWDMKIVRPEGHGDAWKEAWDAYHAHATWKKP